MTREPTWNDGCEHRAAVLSRTHGYTIVEHLFDRFPRADRAKWRRRIEANEVFIDGVAAATDRIVRSGDVVVWRRPPWPEPSVPLSFAILYRDQDLVAVAKPSGLPTLAGGGRFFLNTLDRQLRRVVPDARPAHRLGRHTSGIVLCGRTKPGRASLGRAFQSGEVEKEYLALVEGIPARRSVSVEVPIGPVPHAKLGSIMAADPDGRPSRSEVHLVEARGDRALCRVRIHTGRAHQIRIHCAAIGHPLVGDPLYRAGGLPNADAVPGDGGYHLHAARIVFSHPLDGRRVEISCAAPPALRRAE